jgi:hypothetical protein
MKQQLASAASWKRVEFEDLDDTLQACVSPLQIPLQRHRKTASMFRGDPMTGYKLSIINMKKFIWPAIERMNTVG